ncbi:MAG: enoyl-CoA hydratase/isomerase family protein [Acidimicrobiia bacterium]
MADELVHLERRDDGIAVITLDRPKVNALNGELLVQLRGLAQDLIATPPGAVVVTGGEKIFAAGADITEFYAAGTDPRALVGRFHAALNALAAIPRAVIAAVSGAALGGGLELALACDFRIASEKALFGVPEVQLGLIPGAGGTQRLPRLVGPARAKRMVMSGVPVKAADALAIGLCDEVVPHEQLHDRAFELAAEYARGAIVAQGAGKLAIDRGLEGSLADGLDIETSHFVGLFTTEDAKIGVESFLANGPGKAKFVGR